jgi:hypothetical protein
MTPTTRARLQLVALFILKRLPDWLARPLYLALDPLIGPPGFRDQSRATVRRLAAEVLRKGFEPPPEIEAVSLMRGRK